MPRQRASLPYPKSAIYNRARRAVLLLGLLAGVALAVWAAATSPLNGPDVALVVCVFVPALTALYRLAAERVVADPAAADIRIHNTFRTWRVRWDDIDGFEVTDKEFLLAGSAQWVTCTLRNGRRIRVRAAGRWINSAGGMSPSLTSKQTLSLIAQELDVRRHQHEHGLPIDQLPSP